MSLHGERINTPFGPVPKQSERRVDAVRLQELLEANNRSLEEARAERRAHARTREELAIWKERALTFRAALARLGGVP